MQIINGNCVDKMAELAENSVDSIVTDPPYELNFMGKSWDSSGVAFDIETWKQALRVLKPGGHLLAFSGSRTYHRMVVAIEDAGFEIRDQIMWVYGSGFPKSLDIAKAIQKANGVEPIGFKENENAEFYGSVSGGYNPTPRQLFMPPLEGEAKKWEGWGTALKPAHEPIVLARKPLIGTVANTVLTYGTGGINVDASRVGFSENETDNRIGTNFVSNGGDATNNLNDNQVPNKHYVQMYKTKGRFPANFIHDGSNEVIDLFPQSKGGTYPAIRGKSEIGAFSQGGTHIDKPNQARIMGDDGSAARFFYCAKTSKTDRNEGLEEYEKKFTSAAEFRPNHMEKALQGESGNPFGRYQPVANNHPTVKPTDLMRYLVRLVTPPKGIVLDPFMGSGSTGKACVYEEFDFIGIELSLEYISIAKARIEFAKKNKLLEKEETLF